MVAALVLAAGGGHRYGGPKALVSVDGQRLIDVALAAARGAGCDPIVVVLGCEAERVRSQVPGLAGLSVLVNPAWKAGSGSALTLGLEALTGTPADAVAVLRVETPGVSAEAVRRLAEGADEKSLRAASYAGRRGQPVLLGRAHWLGAATLTSADLGARAYLTAHTDLLESVDCSGVADDSEFEPAG